jgi:XTP/dITP diphosphohydrolase
MPKFQILIASNNPGKIREIQEMLGSLPLTLRVLNEFSGVSPVEEVGETYEQNAVLKALGYAKQTGVCALADDSGLEVAALDGAPGVFSARYGGGHLSDLERTEKLLMSLSPNNDMHRAGRFVCSMALAGWQPGKEPDTKGPQLLTVTAGICEGSISKSIRGGNGFGFDPVFVPKGHRETIAELPSAVKNKISHRAQALAAMREFLARWSTQT